MRAAALLLWSAGLAAALPRRRALRPLALRPATVALRGGSVAIAAAPAAVPKPLPSVAAAEASHAWTKDATIQRFEADLDAGLSQAEVLRRRALSGRNVLVQAAPRTRWSMLADQFDDKLVQILVGVAVLSAVLGMLDADDPTAWVDPLVISLILASNAAVGVWQESSADGALAALEKLQPDKCCARRDGKWDGEVAAGDLVPGDAVYLRVGDKVPADCRLVQLKTAAFSTDEAALTGESLTTAKDLEVVKDEKASLADRTNMIFAGTVVTRGHACGIVTATGMATQIGRVQAGVDTAREDREKTPLAKKLDEFGSQLTLVIGGICALTFAASVPRFGSPVFGGNKLKGAAHYAKSAVALGVAAIPEGLPAVITLCLSLGTRRMAARRVVVRRLPSVETLGCTSVICSDKTGTLTTNAMTVVSLLVPASTSFEELKVSGQSYDPSDGAVEGYEDRSQCDDRLSPCAAVCALCNDAQLQRDEKGAFVRVGEPTETALRVLAEKLGPPAVATPALQDTETWCRAARAWSQAFARNATLEFDRGRKSMSTICTGEDTRLYVKGAPDSVIGRCSHVRTKDGAVPLNDAMRKVLLGKVAQMASRPLRCLALATKDIEAYGDVEAGGPSVHEAFESDLILEGVCGIRDPPRPEAQRAIARCKSAGIRVFMITGDSKETAVAIGKELGILQDSERAWEGNEFFKDASAEAEGVRKNLLAPSKGDGVFCRTAPADKQRIIKLLADAHGDITAMTGDGVNDAPALQQASIGIAMGISGTEVAKQAADMVLMDDNFASIVDAVEEGRAIYKNMQSFICFLLSCNFGEVATVFGATCLGVPDVLTPLQLLWVNLVTDGPPATALGFNPPDPDAMSKPPRDPSAPILTPWLLTRYAVTGSYVGFATIAVFLNEFKDRGVALKQLRSWASCDVSTVEWAGFAPSGVIGDACTGAFGAKGPVKATAQTLALTTLVAMEMLKALSAVSLDHSLLRVPPTRNPWLLAGVALPTMLHLLLLHVAPLRSLFGLAPLTRAHWAAVAKFSLPILLVEEATKAVGREVDRREQDRRASKGDT